MRAEDLLKVPLHRRIDWATNCAQGADQCGRLRAVFCCLARDVAKNTANVMSWFRECSGLFKESSLLVYENDSQDDTAAEYLRHAQDEQVTVLTQKLGARKFGSVDSQERTTQLAAFRNACRDAILDKHGHAFDVAIVFDSDLHAYPVMGLANTFAHWGKFDVMTSNGLSFRRQGGWRLVQYDAYAWREGVWDKPPNRSVNHRVFRIGDPLLPLLSAFGGLAVYTSPAFRAGRYCGGECEHVRFHLSLRTFGFDRLFLNPSMTVFENYRESR